MKILFSDIERRASIRPEGYIEECLTVGRRDGDWVEFEESTYARLVQKYSGQSARWRDVLRNFEEETGRLRNQGYAVADHGTFSRRITICRGGCVFWCDRRGCSEPWLENAKCPANKWGELSAH